MRHVPATPIRILSKRTIAQNTLIEFWQPADFEIPDHSHSFAAMTLVLDGYLEETIEQAQYRCTPHSLLMKPAGVMHSHRYKRNTRCLLIEITHLDFPSTELLNANPETPLAVNEFLTKDHASEIGIMESLYRLISLHPSGTTQRDSRHPPPWLRIAKEFMNDHVHDRIQLNDIAANVGVHPSHLSEVFPKFFDCTAGQYLRRLRLDWAARQIAETTRSIADIALEAGFYDQSHFYRFFKRHAGINPRELRKHADRVTA